MRSAQLVLPATDNLPLLDKLALRAVELLQTRNWDVPGVAIEFVTSREPDGKLKRHVVSLETGNVRMELSAFGITKVHYAQRQLRIVGHSAQLFVYNGDDWARDRPGFRRNPELLKTIEYSDVCRCAKANDDTAPRFSANNRSYHQHDDAFGSTFLSKDGQSRRVQGEFKKIAGCIRRQVIEAILNVPEANVVEDIFDRKQRPLSGISFHVLATREMAAALHAHKTQHVPLPVPLNHVEAHVSIVSNGQVDECVRLDQMLLGGMDKVSPVTPISGTPATSVYPGATADRALLRITPTSANGIYVGDLDRLEEHLSSRPLATKPQSKRNFECSVVPIDAYDNDYARPLVLVSRELDPDEAEVVGGTWIELDNARLLLAVAPDRQRIISDLAKVWKGSENLLSPCHQYTFEQLTRELSARRPVRLITRHRFSGRRRQRTEKLLRNSLAAINDALQMGILP